MTATSDGGGNFRSYALATFPPMRTTPSVSIRSSVAGTAGKVTVNAKASVYGGTPADSSGGSVADDVTISSFTIIGVHSSNTQYTSADYAADSDL